MKYLLILVLAITVGCETNQPNCTKMDPEKAKQVMINFLHAGNYGDFEELRNLTAPDFLLYSDGEEMNFDKLVQFIKEWPEPDKYKFDEFEFEIKTDCNSAFVNYYYGPTDQVRDSTRIARYSVHSAYLKRVENELRIDFLHSTTVEQ